MAESFSFSSSMIAGVEYEIETQAIRATMKDGSVYDVAGVTPQEFESFKASDSKGKFWHRHFKGRAALTGAPRIPIVELPSFTDCYDEDECCGPRLAKVIRDHKIAGDEWRCPKCSTLWRSRILTESSVRHWSPVPEIEIIPVRR